MPHSEDEERACQHEHWTVAKKRYQAGHRLEPDKYGELHVCDACGWSRTVVQTVPDGGPDVSQWSPP